MNANELLAAQITAPSVLSTTAKIRACSIYARVTLQMTSSQFADEMAKHGFKRSTCVTQYNNAKRDELGPVAPKAPTAPRAPKAAKRAKVTLQIDSSHYATMQSPGDTKDCVVRAFAVAAEISYDLSHDLCAKHGRKFRKGTYDHTIQKVAVHELAMTRIDCGRVWAPTMTLRQFIEQNPVGRFMMIRPRHAFAVIDGVVHDWSRGTTLRSKIRYAFKD